MFYTRKASFRGFLYILVLALLAVYIIAPTQGIADGNGGLPVGGTTSGGDSAQPVAPDIPDSEESSSSLLTLMWEVIKFLL